MCQTQNNTPCLRLTTEQSRIIFLTDSPYRLLMERKAQLNTSLTKLLKKIDRMNYVSR